MSLSGANGKQRGPVLAGVCSYSQSQRVGLGVEENVGLLKRLIWIKTRMVEQLLAAIPATPDWELKQGFCYHVWLDAEHVGAWRSRVAEMRHPPHHFEQPPDLALEAFLQEALRADGPGEMLTAVYGVLRPALLAAYRQHRDLTNPLIDQPTCRVLRQAAEEEAEMDTWGQAALTSSAGKHAAWRDHLRAYLAAAGGILGLDPRPDTPLPPPRAVSPFEPDWTPRRDERFESHNYHFPPHWVYAQRDRPATERMLALICKRLLEMDVPEMMAAIIWRARAEAAALGKPKPWDYTREMCRQIWDEARHSMMGEAWLAGRGVDPTLVPLNIGFSLGLNQLATQKEAHAALYWIEQGLMPRTTGKAYEYRTAGEAGDALAQRFMDYDWADEVLHVHIGRRWLVPEVGTREAAEKLGAEAFARVMAVRRRLGLEGAEETEQREWWPDFCEQVLGYRPEPLAPEVYQTPDEDAPWLRNA